MPRPIQHSGDLVNSDSFLDIVASIVSIMIIMVILESTRIKNMPVTVSLADCPQSLALEKELAAERALRVDVLKAAEELQALQTETDKRIVQRDVLATMASAAEQVIAKRRAKLDDVKKADFDLAQKLSEAQTELGQLAEQRERIEKDASAPAVIENYPTPISHAVDGPEAHLQIADGRVLFVPIEPLLEEFQSQAKRQIYQLQNQPELTDTVGPIGGFRLRYTLERQEDVHQGRVVTYARLQRWTLVPTSNDLGEPVRLALQQDSDFRRELAKILPGRTTITIWVYPDGFDAFRQIRKELYRLGYSIAARPLPPGASISGSPEGSKSAAQ